MSTTSWFVDENHVVLPVVRHRLCVDYFLSYTGYFFMLATFLWSLLATVLSAGVSVYFLVSGVLSLIILPWVSYGEWAISHRHAGHVYTYTVVLFWLSLGLIWSGAAGYVHVRQGKEAIEVGWYTLQTQVLPFTTQLDFKASLESNATTIFGLAVTSALLMLMGVGEGWRALGNNLVMMSMKWGWALPEAVTVMLLAGASAAYAVYGATLSAWATNGPQGVQTQLWHAAISILVFVLGCAQLVVPAVWGPGSFMGHALLGVAAAVPSFLLFITSLVLQSTALSVDGFVQPRWAVLQQFTSEPFQGQPWDKYAEACYTPMQEAALAGLMLAIVLACSAVYHLQSAAIVWSIGPQLALARTRLQSQHMRILYVTAAGMPMLLPPGGGTLVEGSSGSSMPTGADAVPDWSSSSGSGGASKSKSSFSPMPTRELSRFGAAALLKATEGGAAVTSPLRGGLSSSYKAYGSVPSSEDGLSEPLASSQSVSVEEGETEGGYQDKAGGYQDVDTTASKGNGLHHRGTSSSSNDDSAGKDGSMPTPVSVPIPEDFPGGSVAAAEARARVAAMQQYQLLMMTYDKQVGAIGKKARCPPCSDWTRTFWEELRGLARRSSLCLSLTGMVMLGVIIGVSVGLMQVTNQSKCGVLGYAPATSAYSTWFQIESGDQGYSPIVIQHAFPYGSVQIIADTVEQSTPRTRNMTIEITAYSASGRNLPSPEALQAMVNISTTCFAPEPGNDDDIGGCFGVSINAVPGSSWADAQAQCLGLQIRILTPVPALLYDITTRSAFVNISGNSKQLVDAVIKGGGSLVPIKATMQVMNVKTDTGAVVAQGLYAARYNEFPPDLQPSLVISSAQGNVYLKDTVAQAASVTTGGNLVVSVFLSASPQCFGICGDINLTTTGKGSLTLTKLIAAYSLSASSEHGAITAVNVAFDVALDINFKSIDAPVTLSNFVQLHGNNTIVRTAGAVNAAAVFSNVLDIVVSGSSKVSVTEAFLGLASPYVDPTDDCAAGDIPFNPAFVFGQNYSYPLLRVITDRGDVAITGVGGDPRSETNSLRDSLYVTSVAGDVKVEVSGNGIAANYTLVSDKGKTTVEVDGLAQPATGQLGVGSDPVAANTVYLYSRDGDVQMSLLPSPI